MATRFFLEASGAPAISPAFTAGWESQVSGDRVLMFTTKQGTTLANKTAAGTGTSGQDIIWRQFHSPPMAIGNVFTAAEAFKGQVRCREASTTNNYAMVWGLRILSADGATVRATLRSLTTSGGLEFDGSALTNRSIVGTYANSYTTVDAGDILVLELGFRCTSGADTANGTGNFGSSAGSDLPEDETTATALDPWFEVVNTLVFGTAYSTVAGVGAFVLAGQATGQAHASKTTAGVGAFVLSGQAMNSTFNDVIGGGGITRVPKMGTIQRMIRGLR